MKIFVKNLGIITTAEVDLSKNLLLFCGENNTGKTYLTYSIYGLKKVLRKNLSSDRIPKVMKAGVLLLKYNLNILIYLEKILDSLLEKYMVLSSQEEATIELPLKDFNEAVKKQLINYITEELKKSLPNLFATSPNSFSNLELGLELNLEFNHKAWYSSYQKTEFEYFFAAINCENDRLYFKSKEEILPSKDLKKFCKIVLLNDLTYSNLRSLNNLPYPDPVQKTFILPAERQGISIFATELTLDKSRFFSKLLQSPIDTQSELLAFSRDNINRYATPIQDTLDLVADLASYRNKTSDFAFLAEELETEILEGTIALSEDGKLQYQPQGSSKALEMHTTSSTIKSLSLLTFYLRHIAKEKELIIIDEPELNLHPNNQVKIARFIARLVNEGFQVLVNTHSDYIIRELNTLIMLASGKTTNKEAFEELMEEYKLDYSENMLLKSEEVGVYLFQKKGETVSVENVEVEADGFEISTIDKTLMEQNERGGDIYNNLF